MLSVGAQGGELVAWMACDEWAPMTPRLIAAVPTGAPLPPGKFVGTAQMDDGLVFHVFDGGER